jgi:drug/metabolite transporter (DMT)-like permease
MMITVMRKNDFFSDISQQIYRVEKRDNTIIWAVIACLLWSTAYAGIKIGLQYDTPFHFAGIRFIFSGLMILPFTVRPTVYIKMALEHWRIIFWVTLLQVLGNYILFYQGLNIVPGALGAVIVGSQPLFTAIVASMMHESEKLTRGKIITIVFGLAGVILISAGRQALRLGTAIEIAGVCMIIGANIATATSNVMVSLKSRGINPFVLSSASFLIGGPIIYFLSVIFEKVPTAPKPAEYWIDLAWLSFMSAAAFSIWYKLLQRPGVRVSELNLWKFIIPVVGAILSWILVPGEKPEWLTIAGMVIITASLIGFFRNGQVKIQSE